MQRGARELGFHMGVKRCVQGGSRRFQEWGRESAWELKDPKSVSIVCMGIQGPKNASKSPRGSPRFQKCRWEFMRKCKVLGVGVKVHTWSKGSKIIGESLHGN